MLLDIRTYRCKPGTIKKHLELYEKMGKKPQSRNLGQPLLFAVCEAGDPNEYTHIWVYKAATKFGLSNSKDFLPDSYSFFLSRRDDYLDRSAKPA